MDGMDGMGWKSPKALILRAPLCGANNSTACFNQCMGRSARVKTELHQFLLISFTNIFWCIWKVGYSLEISHTMTQVKKFQPGAWIVGV